MKNDLTDRTHHRRAADSARRRYRLVFSVLAVVALAGCATIVTAPSGMESSLIVGELKVHVVGTGVDPNGADGFINTISPYSLGMALRDKTTGQLFRLRADNAEGLFALSTLAARRAPTASA